MDACIALLITTIDDADYCAPTLLHYPVNLQQEFGLILVFHRCMHSTTNYIDGAHLSIASDDTQ